MKRSGFTLIELLVVIAIIAILAAILFPVFVSAKDRSARNKCMANLKQLGGAINLYANDWDGWIYPRIYNEYWGGGPNPVSYDAPATDFVTAYYRYVKNGLIFRCPNDGRNEMPSSYRFHRSTPGSIPDRISYVYVGLDIWAPLKSNVHVRRNITDKQKYKGTFGNQGWLMRDKDFLVKRNGKDHLATVHSVCPYPASEYTDNRNLQDVSSNVLLFDGSVAWRRWWDG